MKYANLQQLAVEFKGDLRRNSSEEPQLIVTEFIEKLITEGHEVTDWSMEQWEKVMAELPVPKDRHAECLESVASWLSIS